MDFHAIAPGWFTATIDGRQWYGRSATEIIMLALACRSEYLLDRTAPARSQDNVASHHTAQTPLP